MCGNTDTAQKGHSRMLPAADCRFLHSRLWTVDCEFWISVDFRIVDCGLWISELWIANCKLQRAQSRAPLGPQTSTETVFCRLEAAKDEPNGGEQIYGHLLLLLFVGIRRATNF